MKSFNHLALTIVVTIFLTINLTGCDNSNATDKSSDSTAKLSENEFITTASGLQYKVMIEGQGDFPKKSDTVTVHYRGTLENGTEFDSSYKRGQPASFPLTQVIKGWTEGLQLVKPGGKIKLIIPARLGYGAGGFGSSIPGGATLYFDVELLGIK